MNVKCKNWLIKFTNDQMSYILIKLWEMKLFEKSYKKLINNKTDSYYQIMQTMKTIYELKKSC
jgi:hypothetical protein